MDRVDSKGPKTVFVPSSDTLLPNEDMDVVPSPRNNSYLPRNEAVEPGNRQNNSFSPQAHSFFSQPDEPPVMSVTPPSEAEVASILGTNGSIKPQTADSLNFVPISIHSTSIAVDPTSIVHNDAGAHHSRFASTLPVSMPAKPSLPDFSFELPPSPQSTDWTDQRLIDDPFKPNETLVDMPSSSKSSISSITPHFAPVASSSSSNAFSSVQGPHYSGPSSSGNLPRAPNGSTFSDPFLDHADPSYPVYSHPSTVSTPLDPRVPRPSTEHSPAFGAEIQGPPGPPPWIPFVLPSGDIHDMRVNMSTSTRVLRDFETHWDSQHVKFPCSRMNCYYLPSDMNQPLWKWQYIGAQVCQVTTSLDLEKAIRSWNPTFASSWAPFANLHRLSQVYPSFKSSIMPYILQMALQLPYLFKNPIPLLRRQKSGIVQLSQKQCVSLLANMFLCTFPRRPPRYRSKKTEMVDFPSVSFEELFIRTEETNVAKLQCLMAYFEFHLRHPDVDKLVEFRRQVITENFIPNWNTCHAVLSPCYPAHTVLLEQVAGHWQADFANKVIGGGVLGSGAVQEEIRFSISPECLVSRLFCQALDDNEAILISGSQQYAQYSGYGRNFKFAGNHFDTEVMSHNIVTQVIAFDALSYSDVNPHNQFSPKDTKRELEKALVAFSVCDEEERSTSIATGKWGCGVFKGNPSWKILIQWMAASVSGREIVFCTLNETQLFDSLYKLSKHIQERPSKTTVADLYHIMGRWRPKSDTEDIFPFIMSNLPSRANYTTHQAHPMMGHNTHSHTSIPQVHPTVQGTPHQNLILPPPFGA